MYRTVDAAFWTDPKVRKLNCTERLHFLYLITNPHTHVSGLYYLPELIAQHESGLSAKQLLSSADTLSRLGICRFDRVNELVWVVKMFNFQGRGLKNTLSAARHLSEDVHNSYLVNEFVKAYPEVKEHFKNRVSEFGTPEQEQEQEQEQEEEPLSISSTAVVSPKKYSPEFETFWIASTRRGSKPEAFKEWRKLKPVNGLIESISAGMAAWMKSEQWQDETKQTHICRWLKRRGWEEEVPKSNGNRGIDWDSDEMKRAEERHRAFYGSKLK